MRVVCFLVLVSFSPISFACLGQEADSLYFNGRKSRFEKLVEEAVKADVVFFGEIHDSPTAHRLQLRLAEALIAENKLGAIGLEMIEADDQLLINEYLAGYIRADHLDAAANLWPNYKSDYAPLIELAKREGLPVVATNVPRRYASLVAKEGLGALGELTAEARQYLPPLPLQVPYEQPSYKAMLEMTGHEMRANTFIEAQALKDATMAYRIAQFAKPGQVLFHINGSYHSDLKEGIITYLNQYRPGLRILVISTVRPFAKEQVNKGDFLLETQN